MGSPKAIVYFHHSYGSYLEKYAPVVEFYQRAGFEVVGFDMRGFGHSGGERGMVDSPDKLCGDARNFIEAARVWQADTFEHDLPWIGVGYSLGACYLIGLY